MILGAVNRGYALEAVLYTGDVREGLVQIVTGVVKCIDKQRVHTLTDTLYSYVSVCPCILMGCYDYRSSIINARYYTTL